MKTEIASEKQVWEWLNEVPDPEIPVLSVVELGVVRKVELGDDKAIITITPTYTGCPSMNVFEQDIIAKLNENGFDQVEIKTVWSPAWTTEWLSDEAREELRVYGIAPPVKGSADKGTLFASSPKTITCPKCGSENTEVISQFGSTACKALYRCSSCAEPFEYFKCI